MTSPPMAMEEFEAVVREAISRVPKRLRDKMDNVAFVVEDHVRQPRRREDPIISGGILLGLYQGIPWGARGTWYSGVAPDKITLFKSAIELVAGPDDRRRREIIRQTVWHEIGHYFGMNEAEVRRWEKRRPAQAQPTSSSGAGQGDRY